MPACPASAGFRPALAAALAPLLLVAGPAAARPDDVHGTYRLQGRARVDARPFPASEEEVHADAVVSPGPRAGEVRIRLAGEGFTCDLSASRDATGTLALAQGQRCTADLHSDETEGSVEARLVSGTGRLRPDVLELELAFALSGSVRFRDGGSLEVLGKAFSLPGSVRDPAPVRGEASGRAQGRRDRSQAAQ
jgi:hypothetical protein